MKKVYTIIFIFSILFSRHMYSEIKISNIPYATIPFLNSLGIDMDHIHYSNDYIQFVISEYDLNKLIDSKISYEIIHEDIESYYASRLDNNFESREIELGSMGGYYTYEEIEYHLNQINTEFEALTSLEIIGNTLEGRNVWALKISDNVNIDENEPEVLYTGLHHAREPMSYMNLFYFIDWLLENYNIDDLATHLINNRELWFIPAVNPDGLVYNQLIAPNGGGMQRKNMLETCNGGVDGVDLNRNYSYMWAYDNEGSSPDGCDETFRGTAPFSEPESQNIRNFVQSHDFPIALNYHSYSNLLIYPLGYEYDNPIPEEDLEIFIEFGQDMVQFNNYELGSGPELLYPVNGEACDWMYGSENIFAYTPEIGSYNDGFWPATNRIIPLAEENLYPNQFLGLVAGSKYQVDISIDEGPFQVNQVYPINISIFNQGLGNSNGSVYIDIISSDNLQFELEQIELDGLSSRELIDLGAISYFSILSEDGSVENIIVNIYDDDNFVYSQSLQLITGSTELFLNEDFEQDTGWIVGDIEDDASAGIWERVIPNPTYDENNSIVQTDSDYSPIGNYCFVTGNGTNSNSPGQNDVDGGKTTLLSPIYNLSEFSGAIISYWKWYTNNQGNNPGNDVFEVSVSSNNGENWIILENSNESNNFWEYNQFYLNDYVQSFENIQFRFVAEDIYYDGDNGTGGSLIEAAIDDFSIQVFSSNSDCQSGDLNQDNLTNVQDIVIMVNVVLDDDSDWNSYLCSGDLNSDNLINVQDIVLLVNAILE